MMTKNIKKIKKIKLQKQTKIIKSFMIFLTFIAILSIFIRPKKYSFDNLEVKNLKGIKFDNDTIITQEIVTKKNYSKIGFLASSNNNYVDNGTLYVSIIYKDKVKKTVKILANEICDDNFFYKYYYIKYKFKKNKNYIIRITAKNLSDDILVGKISYKEDGFSLYENEVVKKGNLALSFMYQKPNNFHFWYYFMIISLLIIILIIEKMKGFSYEKNK